MCDCSINCIEIDYTGIDEAGMFLPGEIRAPHQSKQLYQHFYLRIQFVGQSVTNQFGFQTFLKYFHSQYFSTKNRPF